MATFRRSLDDPATIARVRQDQRDGARLGVSGTPTFFVNGEQVRPESYDGFTEILDRELAR